MRIKKCFLPSFPMLVFILILTIFLIKTHFLLNYPQPQIPNRQFKQISQMDLTQNLEFLEIKIAIKINSLIYSTNQVTIYLSLIIVILIMDYFDYNLIFNVSRINLFNILRKNSYYISYFYSFVFVSINLYLYQLYFIFYIFKDFEINFIRAIKI